jgi:hypothetical protein
VHDGHFVVDIVAVIDKVASSVVVEKEMVIMMVIVW